MLRSSMDVWTHRYSLTRAKNALCLVVRFLIKETLRRLRRIRLAHGRRHLCEVLLRDRCL